MDRFARRVFSLAGIYGVLVLAPQYFLADRIGRDTPPPISHVEFYYGFIGVALAWQACFFLIARNPVRLRPIMIPAVLEKLGFGIPVLILFARHEVSGTVLVFGLIDLMLGALFVVSYLRTAEGVDIHQ